jgi:hypothetical protein
MAAPKVLMYEPYTPWRLHGFTAGTIANALRVRGADVTFTACDGLFSDCSMYREAILPRPPDACLACQESVLGLGREMGLSLTWLGRYLRIEEQHQARKWADSLSPEELEHAAYESWPIADWLEYSIHCHIRDAYPDRDDPQVVEVRRSFMYSGLIACFALDRLLTDTNPDVMVVFFGLLASTRLAFEIARQRGVRVVTHYRSPRGEELFLAENQISGAVEMYDAYWAQWGQVPLTASESTQLDAFMSASEHGTDAGVTSFQSSSQSAAEVAQRLGLQPGRRSTWALFMSSNEDDRSRDPDPPFESQNAWIQTTVEYARAHPELDLVIRAHPNIGSARSPGVNRRQQAELAELKTRLPPNVRLVDSSDELNSYGLMDCADCGLVWGSTTGLEMAARGKTVLSVAASQVSDRPYSYTVRSEATYPELLDKLRAVHPGHSDPEIARLARRDAYGVFCRLHVPFPLVRATGFNEGGLLYRSLGSLTPDQQASLDGIWQILIDGAPPCPPPTTDEQTRSDDAESKALARRFGESRAVLSYADELIADRTLLEAWGPAVRQHPGVRLLIETADDQIAALVELVTNAGMLEDSTVELVAGRFTAALSGAELSELQAVRPVAVLTTGTTRQNVEAFDDLPHVSDPVRALASATERNPGSVD